MVETAIIIIIVLVVLGLVIYAVQNIEPLPGPPWIKSLIIALACIVAALYIADRFLN